MKNILVVFAAGCLGALFHIAALNLATHYGILHDLHIQLSGSYALPWVYPRVVWGGLWGFIFLLPVLSGTVVMRSFALCLIPTAVQLFVFYPFYERKGIAGIALGMLTPFAVLFFYWVWALATSITLRLAK
jgi:hypothetical protein